MYRGHSSHLITRCIPSRTINAECGSGEKLWLWEASFSKGGCMCSFCPQWVRQNFWAMARKCRLGFMKEMQTVLQAAKCCHRITWKDGGMAGPGAKSKAELLLSTSWEASGLDGFCVPSTHLRPTDSESSFSTSFSLRTEVRRSMTNGPGIDRRGKEPLAAEYGPRERHPFPSCKALKKFWALSFFQLAFCVCPHAVWCEGLNSKCLNWNSAEYALWICDIDLSRKLHPSVHQLPFCKVRVIQHFLWDCISRFVNTSKHFDAAGMCGEDEAIRKWWILSPQWGPNSVP